MTSNQCQWPINGGFEPCNYKQFGKLFTSNMLYITYSLMTDCPRTVWYKTEKSTWVKSNQHATRMEPENVANKHNECHCAELQSQADLGEWGHHVSPIPHFSFVLLNVTNQDLKLHTPKEVQVYLYTHVCDNLFGALFFNLIALSLTMDVFEIN